ncbi:hypothetical protein OIO90_002821 [Microbotryomycetes sp. JL221]|nr:hypothetical protein OIO90_002821 [Microbotryomycetes sp. JL221]
MSLVGPGGPVINHGVTPLQDVSSGAPPPTSAAGAPIDSTSTDKPKRLRKPLTDEQKARKAQRRRERDALKKLQQTDNSSHTIDLTQLANTQRPTTTANMLKSHENSSAMAKTQDSSKPATRHATGASSTHQPSTQTQPLSTSKQNTAPPQAPPTPALSSPTFSAIPSFIHEDPLSADEDSSSDEDCWGRPKPERPVKYDSQGLPRPRPSYYFDDDYDAATSGSKKHGRRGGLKGIPVFEPTMEEFAAQGGFYGYVKRIEKYGMRSGVVKVIPPKEWVESLPSTAEPLRQIRLREAIEQHMMGSQGLYRVTNVAKTRIWNAAQWKEMSVQPRWAAPNFKEEREKADRTDRTPVIGKRVRNVKADEDGGEQGDDESDAASSTRSPNKVIPRGSVRLGRGGMRSQGATRAESEGPSQQASPPETVVDMLESRKKTRKEQTKTPAGSVEASPARSLRSRSGANSAQPTPNGTKKSVGSAPSSRRGSVVDTMQNKNGKKTMDANGKGTPTKSKTASKEGDKDSNVPKRVTNLQRAEPTDEEWAAFVKHFEELPYGMTKEDYSIEMLRDIERRYWRTLTFGEPPMYGADMAGSLFSDETEAWNVAKLGDLLPKLMPKGCAIPGVVSPYLYFGMWRATFAWHVEDADLYSINYIHFGAPKFWYSVPQEQADRFERVMEGFFPTDRSKCSQFLRHKAFLASPRVLANSGITLNRVVQLPGEFILTYPKGYHSGFNLGFNCAESINFATERWLPLGKTAKACTCISDSVTINVDAWLTEAAKAEALAEGKPWPPPHLVTPPTPPPQPVVALPQSPPLIPMTTIGAGAKRPFEPVVDEMGPKRKKSAKLIEAERAMAQQLHQQGTYAGPSASAQAIAPHASTATATKSRKSNTNAVPMAPGAQASNSSLLPTLPIAGPSGTTHKGQIMTQPSIPTPPKKKQFICALCPSDSTEGLVKIGEPDVKPKKELRAHRLCVMFTPATWIETDPQTQEEIVRGFAGIERARWKLKCQACADMHGAKVQCTKGKCTRAIHATCALKEDSGFFIDAKIGGQASISLLADARNGSTSSVTPASPGKHAVPTSPVRRNIDLDSKPDEAGKDDAADDVVHLTVLCKTHNPFWKQEEAGRRQAELERRINSLKSGDRIRVRLPSGTFDVIYLRNMPDKEGIVARYDDGTEFQPKWKNILWPDAKADSSKQQATAASLQSNSESIYIYSGPKVQPSKKRSAAQQAARVPAVAQPVHYGASVLPPPPPPVIASHPFAVAGPPPVPMSHIGSAYAQEHVPRRHWSPPVHHSVPYGSPPHPPMPQLPSVYAASNHGYDPRIPPPSTATHPHAMSFGQVSHPGSYPSYQSQAGSYPGQAHSWEHRSPVPLPPPAHYMAYSGPHTSPPRPLAPSLPPNGASSHAYTSGGHHSQEWVHRPPMSYHHGLQSGYSQHQHQHQLSMPREHRSPTLSNILHPQQMSPVQQQY